VKPNKKKAKQKRKRTRKPFPGRKDIHSKKPATSPRRTRNDPEEKENQRAGKRSSSAGGVFKRGGRGEGIHGNRRRPQLLGGGG